MMLTPFTPTEVFRISYLDRDHHTRTDFAVCDA